MTMAARHAATGHFVAGDSIMSTLAVVFRSHWRQRARRSYSSPSSAWPPIACRESIADKLVAKIFLPGRGARSRQPAIAAGAGNFGARGRAARAVGAAAPCGIAIMRRRRREESRVAAAWRALVS